jgi:hypothetical protein
VNLAASALENDAEHAALDAKFLEGGAVLVFEGGTVEWQQRFPSKFRRHQRLPVVGRLGVLVGHLEEEQQGELLDVLETGESCVLQHAGVAPRTLPVLRGVHHSPYISVMSRRRVVASASDSDPTRFPMRDLATARIWSTATSAV